MASSALSAYDIPRCLEHLLTRRSAWADCLGTSGADHTGRRPLADLPRPALDADPDPRRRCPLYLARQYRRVLEATPAFVEADDPLPGAWGWQLNDLLPGMGAVEGVECRPAAGEWGAAHVAVNVGMPGHWVPDLGIGLRAGWGGLRRRLAQTRLSLEGERRTYVEALDEVAAAAQQFAGRHADAARRLAAEEAGDRARALRTLAAAIDAVAEEPPQTFRQALVWLSLYMALNRAYNGANVIGRLDQLAGDLLDADLAAGRLNREEAVFLVQALLVRDTHFICLGGTDAQGIDASNELTRVVLDAWRGIRGPANIGLRVHPRLPDDVLERAGRLLLETGEGTPSLVNDQAIAAGLAASGLPAEAARCYAYGGCHWWGVPGRQYGLADGTKINLPAILLEALFRMSEEDTGSSARLWELLEEGVGQAYRQASRLYALHLRESPRVFPELFGSLWAHGPADRGEDALAGGVEHLCFVADVMGLANVADGLVAANEVVEARRACTWAELAEALRTDFAAAPGLLRLLSQGPHFGNDETRADDVAARVRDLCVRQARAAGPTDGRFSILTGFYSWNAHNDAGSRLGATPDGRAAGTPLAHGANPAAGRARQGPTALARSLAAIQPGTGASAPLHLEWDPALARQPDGLDTFLSFVTSCCDLGLTQMVVNCVSRATLEDAIADPDRHRDLVIRVTGFSAYFVNLDPSLYAEILSRYE